jgi:DnaK suppressor protein
MTATEKRSMPRRDALLRLMARLRTRRDALRKMLGADLVNFRRASEGCRVGDPGDAAVDTANDEIAAQLFEIESRELGRIEHALERIAAGAYGRCEHCGGKISASRLTALPCADSCIDCQREIERRGRSTPPAPEPWRRATTFGVSIEGGDDAPPDPSDVESNSAGSASRPVNGLLV